MIVKTHPLAEILAKKLLSIETVPPKEQKLMVWRAIKAAVEFYDSQKTITNHSTGRAGELNVIHRRPI